MATARQNEKLGFSPGYVKGGGGGGDGVSSSVSSLLSAEDPPRLRLRIPVIELERDGNEGDNDKNLNLSELAKGSHERGSRPAKRYEHGRRSR